MVHYIFKTFLNDEQPKYKYAETEHDMESYKADCEGNSVKYELRQNTISLSDYIKQRGLAALFGDETYVSYFNESK